MRAGVWVACDHKQQVVLVLASLRIDLRLMPEVTCEDQEACMSGFASASESKV